MTLYLLANAVMQLFIGPLSDRYGRRRTMLFFMGIALAATLLAIVAPTIELFLLARLLQGTAIAGMVIGRAVIRDMVGPAAAASMIGYVTMAMTLAPMLGPVAGGFLDEWFGWQATFALLFVFGLFAFVMVWRDLGETHHNRASSMLAQMRLMPQLLGSLPFWLHCATAAFASGAFFAFVGGGPYLASVVFGMTPSQYGFYFAFAGVGYITGNFISGRFAARVGIGRMMLAGSCVMVFGMALAATLDPAWRHASAFGVRAGGIHRPGQRHHLAQRQCGDRQRSPATCRCGIRPRRVPANRRRRRAVDVGRHRSWPRYRRIAAYCADAGKRHPRHLLDIGRHGRCPQAGGTGMIAREAIAGVILAGGLSRRMGGTDKGLVVLDGVPLVAHARNRLAPQVARLVVSANGDHSRFGPFCLPVIGDAVPGHAGPLAGIHAAFGWARENLPGATHVLSVAADTPFFPADLAERLAMLPQVCNRLRSLRRRAAFIRSSACGRWRWSANSRNGSPRATAR